MWSRGSDAFDLFVLGLAVVALVVMGISRLTKADEASIRRRLTEKGLTVIWAKRLDTQREAGLLGSSSQTTYYDVLVERDGVRRVEVWRDSLDGLFLDH